jgi:hypothetical protein
MDQSPSAREVRERRRGNPPRGSRRTAPAKAAPASKAAATSSPDLDAVAAKRVEGTVAEVVKWVGTKANRAEAAIAAEKAARGSDARVSLLRKLEAVAS